jgi:hypothetical protein
MPDFGMMTQGHVLYIPFVFTVGLLAGFVLGARSAKTKLERARQRMKE